MIKNFSGENVNLLIRNSLHILKVALQALDQERWERGWELGGDVVIPTGYSYTVLTAGAILLEFLGLVSLLSFGANTEYYSHNMHGTPKTMERAGVLL